MNTVLRRLIALSPLLFAPIAAHADETSASASLGAELGSDGAYTYQRYGRGDAGATTIALETGYGTRETRNFARPGLEQGLSLRLQPTSDIAVAVFVGRLADDGATQFSAETRYRAAEVEQFGTSLDVGLGLTRDYRGDLIPRLRLVASRAEGRVAWSASGNFEVPVGNEERDELDVMIALGASVRAGRLLVVGVEAAGEDLEGLVDDEEAEGGAKLLIGPSLRVELPSDLYLQGNVAAVYTVASNQLAATAPSEPWGLSSRAVLGWDLP